MRSWESRWRNAPEGSGANPGGETRMDGIPQAPVAADHMGERHPAIRTGRCTSHSGSTPLHRFSVERYA